MKSQCIPLQKTGTLPRAVRDALSDPKKLHPFRTYPPSPEGYDRAIEARQLGEEERERLSDRIRSQYQEDGVRTGPDLQDRMEALKRSDTYTVTSGHQLCMFTGPLLTIHKILHTIRLAGALEDRHPDKRFIPLHWMASEDHDREEIDHISIDGELLRWNTDQTGAVGRMKPEGMEELFQGVRQRSEGFPYGEEWAELLVAAYEGSSNWAQATRKLLHHLFGDLGLLILDGDDIELKRSIKEDLKKELIEQRGERCIRTTDQALQEAGYEARVHVRPINLFYLTEGYRERLQKKGDGFATADGRHEWDRNGILEELEEDPERFSPNVVLRPLYQERILPNIAYVGGPAEIAYWHQLKGLFQEAGAFFPLLQPRSQIFHASNKIVELMEKLHLNWEDLFQDRDANVKERVKERSEADLELDTEKERIHSLYKELAQKASDIDPNLWDSVMAEHRKAEKGMERIQKKMIRHAKKRDRILWDRMDRIHAELFPGGTPQERKENLSLYYSKEGKHFLQRVAKELHPFHAEAILIVEKES